MPGENQCGCLLIMTIRYDVSFFYFGHFVCHVRRCVVSHKENYCGCVSNDNDLSQDYVYDNGSQAAAIGIHLCR